jgi:hypothetical protein
MVGTFGDCCSSLPLPQVKVSNQRGGMSVTLANPRHDEPRRSACQRGVVQYRRGRDLGQSYWLALTRLSLGPGSWRRYP